MIYQTTIQTVMYNEHPSEAFKSLTISFEPKPRKFPESWLGKLYLMVGHWIVIDQIDDWKIIAEPFFDEFYEKGEYSNDEN